MHWREPPRALEHSGPAGAPVKVLKVMWEDSEPEDEPKRSRPSAATTRRRAAKQNRVACPTET
jgi:hypothetical protein